MTKEDLIKVIANALEIDSKKLNHNSTSSNTKNWDSIGHLSILMSLDRKFDGKISNISSFAKADSIEKIFTELKKNKLI